MPLKVLFIGGTGIISAGCAQLAAASGLDLHVLNRGRSTLRPLPDGARVVNADVRDTNAVRRAIGDEQFDVVVDFLSFTAEHVGAALDLFHGRTGQYVFISSAAVYERPSPLPLVESAPLGNPYSAYGRNKIHCELVLARAHAERGFPVTVVRPSHTYDATAIPFDGGWTVLDRMRRGKEVLVHGDGTSLWTMTHTEDFAHGFLGILGDPQTVGETYHLTGDEVLTWNEIYRTMAEAAGAEARLVHVPSAAIAAADPRWGEELLGDKSHSLVFDNAKVRRISPGSASPIPFSRGAQEIVRWYDSHPDQHRVDERLGTLMDALIEVHRPRPLSPAPGPV
ncbi:NAD-dependent epimerase/dehydratase family protein [Streptomyces sp. NPDC088348]|uniref:NAD-dependent epimerase/dehydratase family protein n=1 Tax=Streptomyces sp. NPDC088348 TaxID=3365853 RepID=UPI003804C834